MAVVLEQRTFKDMGKLPVLPIAPHLDDMVICENMGEWKRRGDCLEAADGSHWNDDEDLEDCNEHLVREYLEGVIEWSDEYRASEDCGDGYAYLIGENRERMEENVNEWLEDNVENYEGCPDLIFDDIIDELFDLAEFDCSRGCFSSPKHDVNFESFDVGEVEEQIDIDQIPLLKVLHDRGALEGILEEVASDCGLYRWNRDPYIEGDEHPTITLMNNTDLWYHFGCSGETLLEVYHNHTTD